MIAARLAVNVHRGLIDRLLNPGIKFKLARVFVELAGLGIQFVQLAQHGRAAVLLTHFHRVALESRPHLVERILVHPVADFIAMFRIAAMFGAEGRQDALFIG